MATQLAWTDSTGAATLTNGKPAPADRFSAWRNWPSSADSAAVRDVAVGTGLTFRWRFRHEHLASFELRMIPMASLNLLERLKDHLEGGGQVTVTVDDAAAHVHTCVLAPGADVEYEQADPKFQEYTLRLTLRNTADAALLASY